MQARSQVYNTVRWSVLTELEWNALQWTLSGIYFTALDVSYCSLNNDLYSEHYLDDTSQQVGTGIAAWINCVTGNITWKMLHMWTLILQSEWRAIQWILFGRYLTLGEGWYYSLNKVPHVEHYVEGTSQHLDTGITAWIHSVTINIKGSLGTWSLDR
jgi:hypothetical protein